MTATLRMEDEAKFGQCSGVSPAAAWFVCPLGEPSLLGSFPSGPESDI